MPGENRGYDNSVRNVKVGREFKGPEEFVPER